MRQKSTLVLPCDPEYIAHREAQRRRRETREWLLQRERANLAPSIVPDVPEAEPYGDAGTAIRTRAVD
jgi:hypothetical protein